MRISWDEPSSRTYDEGVSKGVFYPESSPGVPWNGLISVTEDADPAKDSRYFDGMKYRDRITPSAFSGVIEAYTYPDAFSQHDGVSGIVTGQRRALFGFSYRTRNDLHLVYNVMLFPAPKAYASIGDSVNASAFQWKFATMPEDVEGFGPSAHLVIIVGESRPEAISDLEEIIYGNDTDEPRLPPPSEVFGIFDAYAEFIVTDNGDGSWTATGPGDSIVMLDGTSFEISGASVIFFDSVTYRISSL